MILVSDSTKKFISLYRFDNPKDLALKKDKILFDDNIDFEFALQQINGQQKIKNKLPSWYNNTGLIYPSQLPLEQCSSEITAKYKASLLSGKSFCDLTGGFGVDCFFIAKNFQTCFYIERQRDLSEIVNHNFQELKAENITIINEDMINYLPKLPDCDWIFIDPARRSVKGEKVISIQNCEPNISIFKDRLLETAKQVLVKLSPMLDITAALLTLPETSEIHIISINNECKELLFILNKAINESIKITCIDFNKQKTNIFSFYKHEEQNANLKYTSDPLDYLYEPNASILKAGAFKIIAKRFNLNKLHPDSHLYTSKEFIENFPGRIFKIDSVFPFNKTELKKNIKNIDKINLSIRNFPSTTALLRKKLKLIDGGEDYLFATTLENNKHVLIKGKRINMNKE